MTVAQTGNNSIDSLLIGESWLPSAATAAGTAVTTISYSFMTTAAQTDGATGFLPMTANQQQAVQTELQTWANVANIKFTQATSGGQIEFGTADLGTGSSGQTDWDYSTRTGIFSTNYVYLNNDENYQNNQASSFNQVFTPGSYGPSVLIHEIGHSLGLKHPGSYDGTPGPYLPAATDNRDYSVMSYNNGTAYNDFNSQFKGDVYSVSPMLYDIQAMQYLYGANMSYNSGDTTYSFANTTAPQAIWDGGGTNTFNFSACTGATIINLNAGTFSSTLVSGGTGAQNIAIAYGVTIQDAIAGAGASTIYCNTAADTITGGAGNDTIYLSTGSAAIDGKGGTNTVIATAASDISHDSFADVQSLQLGGYDTTLTTEQFAALSGIWVNPGAMHFSDAGTVTASAAITTYYLIAGDNLVVPASAATYTVHGAGTGDSVQLSGNATDFTIVNSTDGSYVSVQNAQTKLTVDLFGGATLQFADGTLASSTGVFTFIAAQNEAREASGLTTLFHYGYGSQTADNVVGEQSATLGSGYNAVVLAGARSQYSVSAANDGTLTIGDTASGQSYTVTGDHYLIFDNAASGSNAGFQDIDFVLQGTNAQVASLYNAALGRLPDLNGLEFYGNAFAAGSLNLQQTATDFLASPEFLARFTAAAQPADNGGTNDQAFITQLYQNVLHRTPSASELNFYVQDLQGTLAGVAQQHRPDLLINFALSPENQKDISGWLI